MRTFVVSTLAALAILAGARPGVAQTPPPQIPEQPAATLPKNDTDPTRPVLFSIRPEVFHPAPGFTQGALTFRYDRAAFRQRRWLPGRRGTISRFELPVATTSVEGFPSQSGLGDAYAQLLLIPYLSRRFAFVAGSGLILPTATGNLLGTGKWVAAPAVGPVWLFPGRGMLFVKVQNLTSFAGDAGRPDINALLITPSLLYSVKPGWWVLLDSESRTNWEQAADTAVKTGLQIGHALGSGVGIWVKPELFWGQTRDGRWNLKFGIVWYRP
jgi:hypothetical protein